MSFIKSPLFFFIIALLCLTSCIGPFAPREHQLSADAYAVNPYIESTTLLFESNTYEIDTLFIKNIKKAMVQGGDAFSVAPDRFENYLVNYSSSSLTKERNLVYVGWYDEGYDIRFEFMVGQARLVCRCSFTEEEFKALPDTTMTVAGNLYSDVKVLNGDSGYEDRDHRVIKLYWSISTGLLGWETPAAIWKLKKVYKP